MKLFSWSLLVKYHSVSIITYLLTFGNTLANSCPEESIVNCWIGGDMCSQVSNNHSIKSLCLQGQRNKKCHFLSSTDQLHEKGL